MLGLSGGEVAVIILAGVVCFGPKDVPKIARAAGRLTGRAMAFLFNTRDRIQQAADKAELAQLHGEIKQTMAQLQSIRYEALRGVHILNEPPSFAAQPVQQHLSRQHLESTPATAGATDHQGMQQPLPSAGTGGGTLQEFVRHPSSFSSLSGKHETPRFQASSAQLATSLSQQPESLSSSVPSAQSGLRPLPISASSAGLTKERAGLQTGSELLVEALLEAQVAAHAKTFMDEHKYIVRGEKDRTEASSDQGTASA